MGFRFRKSFKIAPGIKLSLNKKSVGLRIGGKGAGISLNSNGRVTKTVGIPGTGLYYTDSSKLGGKTKGKKKSSKKTNRNTQSACNPHPNAVNRVSPQGVPPKQKKPLDKKTIIIASAIVIGSFLCSAIITTFSPDVETTATTGATTEITMETTAEAETMRSVPTVATTPSSTEAKPQTQTEAPTQTPTQPATRAAASTTKTQQVAQPSQETTYMLNENTGKYHHADCHTIKKSKNLREINAEEAKNYSPCEVCKP